MAKSPAEFDMFKVVEQLRCAGVIEAIRITMIIGALPFSFVVALMCISIIKAIWFDLIRKSQGVPTTLAGIARTDD